MFMECLWNVYGMFMECLWTVYGMFMEFWCEVLGFFGMFMVIIAIVHGKQKCGILMEWINQQSWLVGRPPCMLLIANMGDMATQEMITIDYHWLKHDTIRFNMILSVFFEKKFSWWYPHVFFSPWMTTKVKNLRHPLLSRTWPGCKGVTPWKSPKLGSAARSISKRMAWRRRTSSWS